TNPSGHYSFTGVPAGTYPVLTAAAAGYLTGIAASITIADGGTTTQNLSLASAPVSACFTDTTKSDFLAGAITNCDLASSPGSVILTAPTPVDQQNTTLSNSGVVINNTTWGGQTFTPGGSGQLVKADISLFCFSCAGSQPNLTLSVRATSGGLPTGPDLAT